MVTMELIVLLVTCCLLPYQATARPNGPPAAACTGLAPNHSNNLPQEGRPPVLVEGIPENSTYSPMNTLEFTLDGMDDPFRGFMIQARASISEAPLGTFTVIDDGKQQGMMCRSPADTLSHKNRNYTSLVRVRWSAETLDSSITTIKFYCSIVYNFTTFWVAIPSGPIAVVHPISPGDINYPFVKAHGSVMVIAWGLFAPVGILLALFYKIIWPNGEWFYTHIAIMVATLLLTIVGIILIVIHARGLWLTTTDTNLPHQLLGILVCVAVAVNPFMAICRCDPNSPLRPIFNWTHGFTGLIFGQGLALGAMLLGLHAFKDLPGVHQDRIHYAIYVMSAIVGLLVMTLTSYNLYAIMFRKYFRSDREPDTLATTSEAPADLGSIPDKPFQFQRQESVDDDEVIEASEDYPLRAGLGVAFMVVFVLLVLAIIVLLALA